MKLLSAIRWCIALAAMALSLPAMAFDTAEIGSQVGSTYDQKCGGESLIVGFQYSAGKALDALGIICAIRKDGWWTGDMDYRGRVGGGGGEGLRNITCVEQGKAVVGVHVFVDKHGSVRHIIYGCFTVPGNDLTYYGTENSGGEDAYSEHTDCPPGQYATGIYGHFDGLINSIGLHCKEPPIKAPQPPPPLSGNNNPPAADNPPAAAQASARTDTTVYQVKGQDDEATNQYLTQGEPVTIDSCDENWCRISAPYSGWVWGEDLNR